MLNINKVINISLSRRNVFLFQLHDIKPIKIFKELDLLKKNYLIIILSGELKIGEQVFRKNTILRLPNLKLSFDYKKLKLLCIELKNTTNKNQNIIKLTRPKIQYFDKYDAKIGRLICKEQNKDLLNPWSLYLSELDFSNKIHLHLHKNLKNILVFIGRTKEVLGYLLIKKDNKVYAYPLKNGDVAVVMPNVIHNVCARKGEKLKFYVVNDAISEYEEPSNSDYHNLHQIQYNDLIIQQRVTSNSLLYNF